MLRKLRLFLFGLIVVGLGLNFDLEAERVFFPSADIMASIEAQFPPIDDVLGRTVFIRSNWGQTISIYRGFAKDLRISIYQRFDDSRMEVHPELSEGFLTHDMDGFLKLCIFLTDSVYAQLLSPEFRKTYVVRKFVESMPDNMSVVDYAFSLIDQASPRCTSPQDQRNLILAKATLLNLLLALLDCAQIQKEVSKKVGRTRTGHFDYQNGPNQIFSGIRGIELSLQIPVVPRIGKRSRKYLYDCGMISRFLVNKEVERELDGSAGLPSSDYFIFDDPQTDQYIQAIKIFVSIIPPVASLPRALSSPRSLISPAVSSSFSGTISPSLASRPSPTRSQSPLLSRSTSRERLVSPIRSASQQRRSSISPIRTSLPKNAPSLSPLQLQRSSSLRSVGSGGPGSPRQKSPTFPRPASPALSRTRSSSFEYVSEPEAELDFDALFVQARAQNAKFTGRPFPGSLSGSSVGSVSPRTTSPRSPARAVSSASSSSSAFVTSLDPRAGLPKITSKQMEEVKKRSRGLSYSKMWKYAEEEEAKKLGLRRFVPSLDFFGKKKSEDPWGLDNE